MERELIRQTCHELGSDSLVVHHHPMGSDLLRAYRHQRHRRVLGATSPRYPHFCVSCRYWSFEPILRQILRRGRVLDQYHQDLAHLWSHHVHLCHYGRRVSDTHTQNVIRH